MKNRNVKGSIVAGRSVIGSVNANNSKVKNDVDILREARKQSFWISLIVGVISSFIASFLFWLLIH